VNTRERLQLVLEDTEKDAKRPLLNDLRTDPGELRRAVSQRLGEVYAMIEALAKSMLEQQDAIEQVALACDQREAWRTR
jgi:hypothetical protein